MVHQQAGVGHLERRQAPGDVSDQGDVPGLEVEHPRGDESAHQEHECSGDLRGDPPETEDDDERHDPDHRRGGVRLVQRGQPRPELLERVAALAVGAGQLGQLPDDDVDRCAEEESGDDGTGEELRQPPHPEHGEGQEEQSGRQRDPGHQGGHVGGIGQAGRQDRAARRRRRAPSWGPSRSGGSCRTGRRGSPRRRRRRGRSRGARRRSPAYPRFLGMISAATTTPATRSPRSQARW